jgi:predicted amino acid dehydrogenase
MMAIPMAADQLLGDQDRILRRMERAVALAEREGPLHAVGLGALCAVVAGRGEALGQRIDLPVTTGAAATAWALFHNTSAVVNSVGGGPVAVVGSGGVVGRVVAELLSTAGIRTRVDSRRGGKGLDVEVFSSAEEAVRGCPVVAGAGPTGGSLDGDALARGAVVVDVAIPGTIKERPPRGVRVLAGEALTIPDGWTRDGWGHLFHVLAGYGPRQVFACLVEPLVVAVEGRAEPLAQGRGVTTESVEAFGRRAYELGFRPRLARGWRGVDAAKLRG